MGRPESLARFQAHRIGLETRAPQASPPRHRWMRGQPCVERLAHAPETATSFPRRRVATSPAPWRIPARPAPSRRAPPESSAQRQPAVPRSGESPSDSGPRPSQTPTRTELSPEKRLLQWRLHAAFPMLGPTARAAGIPPPQRDGIWRQNALSSISSAGLVAPFARRSGTGGTRVFGPIRLAFWVAPASSSTISRVDRENRASSRPPCRQTAQSSQGKAASYACRIAEFNRYWFFVMQNPGQLSG